MEPLEEKVRQIFSDLFFVEKDSLTAETSSETLPAWDSLQHLNLVTSLEAELGLSLRENDIVAMVTFGNVLKIVEERLATR